MTPGDRQELLVLATDIAMEAGRLLVDRLTKVRTAISSKSTATDMVSEVDRESEALIVRRILDVRPDDAILGEEGTERTGTSGLRWVIDPLDGTTNYLYGIAAFCVSIGIDHLPAASLTGFANTPSVSICTGFRFTSQVCR